MHKVNKLCQCTWSICGRWRRRCPRSRLSLHVISRAQCKFFHMFNMCTYCYDNALQGKTIFHSLGEGERGKSRTLAWAALALDLGLRLCTVSLTLSAFYDLSCLSHRLYSFLFFPHSTSSLPPSFLPYSPCHCRLSVNQQATCQRLLLQLCCSSSFFLSGIGIGTAQLLSSPSSLPPCCLHYVHIYLSKCNYTL